MCGPKFCSMKIHGHLEEAVAGREQGEGNGSTAPAKPLQVVP
jgi:phosphomethylpyrimidine synthase